MRCRIPHQGRRPASRAPPGLEQARGWARGHLPALGPVLIGLAHNNRECWVLAGFEPRDDPEREQLSAVCEELKFDPCQEAHRLTARHEHQARSAKRVLALLTRDSWERQADCWRTTALSTLERRGQTTGLADYLRELREYLVPLFR